jgi:hypothetical protein
MQADDARTPAGVPGRVLAVEALRQPVHVVLRLRHGDAGFQPPDRGPAVIAAVLADQILGSEVDRREQLARTFARDWKYEAARQHADDLPARLVQSNRLADDVGRAAEAALPEAVAEHHDAVAVDLLAGGEGAAQQRRDADRREEVPADLVGARIGRLAGLGVQPVRRRAVRGQRLERLLHPAPITVGLGGEGSRSERFRPEGVVLERHRQPVVLVERKAAQHDRVHDRIDRGRGADPERHHGERDSRKRGRLAQRPGGRPQAV